MLALGVMAAPAGVPTVRLPDAAQLERAVRSGDDVEIERVAARLGPVRLAHMAQLGARAERLAALRAVALVDDAWAMLPELSALLSDGDGDFAEAAGLAVRQIAAGLTPQAMEAGEVPRDIPARAARTLGDAAARSDLRVSVRASAIAAVASLRGVVKLDEGRLLKLATDPEAQIRRAAIEALAAGPSSESTLVAALGDGSNEVAAAAAAVLCRDVPATASPKNAAAERAARLLPAARDRLRALALDEQVALVDRIDLVGCLRVFAQPPDQKALDTLARRPPESLKRRARSLGGR